MKLYISGPMSNFPEHNFPAFRTAAAKLTAAGYDVIDPSENFGGDTTLERAKYMREDISNVLKADGLALLPGWHGSKGAGLEVAIAQELGLETCIVDIWLRDKRYTSGNVRGIVLNKGGKFEGLAAYASLTAARASNPTMSTADFMATYVAPAKETILEEAQRLVHGDRGAAYGHPADDFSRTAEYWTTTFKAKLKAGEKFTAGDIPLALIGVKLSREVNKPKRDNMTDLAGYAETRRMVLERDGA